MPTDFAIDPSGAVPFEVHDDGVDIEYDGEELAVNWEYWEAQLEALAALESEQFDLVVFRGGYGSGKSVLGARWILNVAAGIPHSDNLILAPDAAKGGPTTYKVFFEQLPGEDTVPDEGGDPTNSPLVTDYNRVEKRLTLANGSIVRLGSADVWNRYAGGEFNAIWCDEVAHYGTTDLFQLNEMLLSRQRTSTGPNVALWTSTGNGYNQFYQFVEVQETPDSHPLPTVLHNVVADSRNNPYLQEKGKIARQFEGTGREAEALEGGFAALEGLVYADFSRERHVRPAAAARALVTDDWRIYGYDHGWNDPRVLLEIGRSPAGQYVVLDRFYEHESTVEDAVAWLKDEVDHQPTSERLVEGEHVPDPKPPGVIYAEHEPEHIQKFRRAGWDAESANKDLDEGIPVVRARLQWRDDPEDRPGLLVSDACPELINEFQTYKEEHVGKSGAPDHNLDSLRYALMGVHTPQVRQETRRRNALDTKGRRRFERPK